ncbi:MAG: Fe-S cluster assembly protein SufB [Saprospiraceae bacterium]
MSDASMEVLEAHAASDYKYGWSSDIETDTLPPGLNEDVVRFISAKKDEPQWLLDYRLEAYRVWRGMTEPTWVNVDYEPIDFEAISYYAAPVEKPKLNSLDEVDPELIATFNKLGISLEEQKFLSGVAVDVVMDSVSVTTTYKERLAEVGIIFCSFSEAVKEHPELVRKYMGTVIPTKDNFYAALNNAVFSDGSFVYIPKGVRCPMELSTYFRINAVNTGQFERTLIIAEEGSYVSYLEGCTAPKRDENQLHAAIVELVAHKDAEIKYSTVQNWFPGDKNGVGGIYNFVTKRGLCEGDNSKISWTQVETGSAITWKYPSCVLKGDNSVGEFYSVAVTNNLQQADTGTKMIHIGKNTRSTIISKGISAGRSQNTYRGLVKVLPKADNARNFSQCDSLLMGDKCGAHTFPYLEVDNKTAQVEHEATTSKIGEDQLFYLKQRGLSEEDALNTIVNGFCKDVFAVLPMEFAAEAKKLLAISLENSVG